MGYPLTTFLAVALALSTSGNAWAPGSGVSPVPTGGFTVNAFNKRDVLSFYQAVYNASGNYAANINWAVSGSVGPQGTTSALFKDDVLRRINFYRALCGLPSDITFNSTKSAKSQQAALMMSRNNALSHSPPTNWSQYTAAGAEAAGNSNLALGSYGPGAVDGYMRDNGGSNQIVGHRRWLLYSRGREMGTGDVPPNGSYPAANSIWVIGDPKPLPAPHFVAWPNAGYVPYKLVPARWSLSYPSANFVPATVTMTRNGSNVPLNIVSDSAVGYADNTIIWEPAGLPSSVTSDVVYQVNVGGITGAGIPASHSYQVTLFDPDVLGETVGIAGDSSASTTGTAYSFNTIAGADGYELKVSTADPAPWTEGAEDATAGKIFGATSGVMRQSALKRSGSKAFQIAFPNFEDQSFEIHRDLIPTAASQLVFYHRSRFTTATTTISAELSTNGGDTWTSVWARSGVGLQSTLWDQNWVAAPAIPLSAYAGQVIRLRFAMRRNGLSIVTGSGDDRGFFLDDISVTNSSELFPLAVVPLSNLANAFILNSTTAGGPLIDGKTYQMSIRPSVGLHWFGFGPLKNVVAHAPDAFQAWAASHALPHTQGRTDDYDRDGISNMAEFAFGLNPSAVNGLNSLPQPAISGNSFVMNYATPAGVSGVHYAAEWSVNLVDWNPLPDNGSGNNHVFSVNTSGKPKLFMRHKIVMNP